MALSLKSEKFLTGRIHEKQMYQLDRRHYFPNIPSISSPIFSSKLVI